MDFLEAGHIIAYFIIGVLCFKRSAPIPAPALLRRLITPAGFHVSALFQFSVFFKRTSGNLPPIPQSLYLSILPSFTPRFSPFLLSKSSLSSLAEFLSQLPSSGHLIASICASKLTK